MTDSVLWYRTPATRSIEAPPLGRIAQTRCCSGCSRPFAGTDTEFAADGFGVYPNPLCAHPPFQLDGNLGGGAAIAEMRLQSHDGTIQLLPALTAAWSSGRVRGLCARGGFELELAWQDRPLACARVRSLGGNPCKVHYRARRVQLETSAGREYDVSRELCAEPSLAGHVQPAGGAR